MPGALPIGKTILFVIFLKKSQDPGKIQSFRIHPDSDKNGA